MSSGQTQGTGCPHKNGPGRFGIENDACNHSRVLELCWKSEVLFKTSMDDVLPLACIKRSAPQVLKRTGIYHPSLTGLFRCLRVLTGIRPVKCPPTEQR